MYVGLGTYLLKLPGLYRIHLITRFRLLYKHWRQSEIKTASTQRDFEASRLGILVYFEASWPGILWYFEASRPGILVYFDNSNFDARNFRVFRG